jgi:hypothetical protein
MKGVCRKIFLQVRGILNNYELITGGLIIMTDSRKKDNKSERKEEDNAVLLAKLKSLEDDLSAINSARTQRTIFSLVGGILIIIALVMFLMDISSFFKAKVNSPDFKEELFKQTLTDVKTLKENPNLQQLVADLKGKVLPALAKEVVSKFKAEIPNFKAQGDDFIKELQIFLQEDAKKRIEKSLLEYLIKVEGTLKTHYPNLSADDLNELIESSQAVFILELDKVLQKKLNIVQDDLAYLKATTDKFKECDEYKLLTQGDKHSIHYAKMQLVVSMLELVIFHIDPDRGKIRFVDTVGGVK